jgi:hypothetical protein
MPKPEALLTWLFLLPNFLAAWIRAGFDLMTGAKA